MGKFGALLLKRGASAHVQICQDNLAILGSEIEYFINVNSIYRRILMFPYHFLYVHILMST